MVVVVAAAVPALLGSSSTAEAAKGARAPKHYVALGDSYAGPGIPVLQTGSSRQSWVQVREPGRHAGRE